MKQRRPKPSADDKRVFASNFAAIIAQFCGKTFTDPREQIRYYDWLPRATKYRFWDEFAKVTSSDRRQQVLFFNRVYKPYYFGSWPDEYVSTAVRLAMTELSKAGAKGTKPELEQIIAAVCEKLDLETYARINFLDSRYLIIILRRRIETELRKT